MRSIRHILTLAALALAGTLAACSDGGTAPQVNDDPVAQQLNRLATGQAQVLSVKHGQRRIAGNPAAKAEPGEGLQSLKCTRDEGCEPIDRTCYSNCSWFDVDADIQAGTTPNYKWVALNGWFYGHTGGAYPASLDAYFYSAGGCSSTPGLFYSVHMDADYPYQDLLAYNSVDYTGQFNWALYVEGWGTNIYGREGYETDYASLCY